MSPHGYESKPPSTRNTIRTSKCTPGNHELSNKNKEVVGYWLALLAAYLSLSESLNQTIGSSPQHLMQFGQTLLVSVALLLAFEIPELINNGSPLSLRSTFK
jgi:hypothetical protein